MDEGKSELRTTVQQLLIRERALDAAWQQLIALLAEQKVLDIQQIDTMYQKAVHDCIMQSELLPDGPDKELWLSASSSVKHWLKNFRAKHPGSLGIDSVP